MKVEDNIVRILAGGRMVGALFFLPDQPLDRETYVKVNKVLELAGGKWNRGQKAHVFPDSSAEALEGVILTGEITDAKKEFQFFETPPQVVNRMLHIAGPLDELRVLEPSAGHGAIAFRAAEKAAEVMCMDLQDSAIEALRNHRTPNMVIHHPVDFLSVVPASVFDRVLMNPPFTKGQDVKHIAQALKWLAPGGLLVSVASAGVLFRNDGLYPEIRSMAMARGTIEELPTGSFASSGTQVNTVIVAIPAE